MNHALVEMGKNISGVAGLLLKPNLLTLSRISYRKARFVSHL